MSKEDYLKKMDIPMTNNAIQIAGFPPEVEEWMWEVERKPFAIFTRRSRG